MLTVAAGELREVRRTRRCGVLRPRGGLALLLGRGEAHRVLSGDRVGSSWTLDPPGSSPGRTGGWQLCFSAAHLLGAREVTLFSRLSLCSGGSPGAPALPSAAALLRIPGPPSPAPLGLPLWEEPGEGGEGGGRVRPSRPGLPSGASEFQSHPGLGLKHRRQAHLRGLQARLGL